MFRGGISRRKSQLTSIHDGTSNVVKCPNINIKIIREISYYMDKHVEKKGKKRKEVIIELPSK